MEDDSSRAKGVVAINSRHLGNCLTGGEGSQVESNSSPTKGIFPPSSEFLDNSHSEVVNIDQVENANSPVKGSIPFASTDILEGDHNNGPNKGMDIIKIETSNYNMSKHHQNSSVQADSLSGTSPFTHTLHLLNNHNLSPVSTISSTRSSDSSTSGRLIYRNGKYLKNDSVASPNLTLVEPIELSFYFEVGIGLFGRDFG